MKRGEGRRAQLTVFILVGLLLVVATSLILFLTYNQPRNVSLPLVPAQVRPVYDIVDACAKQIGESAIRRAAAQGGYLDLPPVIAHTPTSYIPMDDAGFLKVPLWYYDGEDRVPPVSYMEDQLAQEIQAGMPECINHFAILADQFTVQEQGNLSVNVVLAADNVVVRVTYPLTWHTAGQDVSYSEFISILDAKLLSMWTFANATMVAENNRMLLENATVDLMAMNPDIPMDAMTFDCTPKTWRLPEVRNTLQESLRVNLPSVRFANTNYPPFDEPEANYAQLLRYKMQDIQEGRLPSHVPDDAYEYTHLFWDVGASLPDMHVALTYQPRWGMALNGNPNDNGVLQSRIWRNGGGYLNFVCINTYHITYDVIYPVLFTITDDKAFSGAGLSFQMAFPVLIKTNAPDRSSFGLQSFQGFETAEGFCDNTGDSVVDIRATGVQPGDMMATELDGASFTLDCVGRQCILGNSSADDGAYRLRTRLPAGCTAPVIIADKPGYLEGKTQVQGDSVSVPLTPLRNVSITIVKHPYDLTTGAWGDPLPLSDVENVSVRITKANSSFDTFFMYPQTKTVQLVDGIENYDVTLLLSQFGDLSGGFVQQDVALDSTNDRITFHVLEGRPVAFNDDYRQNLATYLYGNDYQARLAPVPQ